MDFKELEKKVLEIELNIKSKLSLKEHDLYWSNAIAAEVGEYCNFINKKHRDDIDIRNEIRKELADIFNLLILNAKHHGINLEEAILNKIKIIRKKYLREE